MSHYEHPEREKAQQAQKRKNQLTALFAGLGVGLAFALIFGLLLDSWPFATGVGVVIAAAVTFGLNAVRKDSRKIVDEVPESK